ncbi:SDR family oxidoreductase [Bacillus sp. B15-48]|uniref:SDR family NAD(P)-dependent oxidoreductase n=1 Tax=Bacillus sp. B15-48 TaxID=1548601 RepID=UPI00193F805E|nr:SDR family oxidoreductase [Bacillus sp. B15-48]MBM4763371.1 SDR family oxidoreductase [Bacillus sp. B15-48]
MELGLNGKVALITGGSKGIGLATATRLAKEGAKIAIFARNKESLNLAAKKISEYSFDKVVMIAGDASIKCDCQRAINEVVEHFGQIDILVNNAGVGNAYPFEEVTTELWQEDLDLKLFGAIHCSRFAIPHMRKAGGGAIVNITTNAAKAPPASSLPTTVSRAAGQALTKAMSRDLAADSIRVNTVCIGIIRSDQLANMRTKQNLTWEEFDQQLNIPLGRSGNVEEAANVISFLASHAASYVTGTAINVDGGGGATL